MTALKVQGEKFDGHGRTVETVEVYLNVLNHGGRGALIIDNGRSLVRVRLDKDAIDALRSYLSHSGDTNE